MTYDSLNDWNDRQNAAELAARPFYLIGQDTLRIQGTPRFASEDEAHDWVVDNLGADAWNDTAILVRDEIPQERTFAVVCCECGRGIGVTTDEIAGTSPHVCERCEEGNA